MDKKVDVVVIGAGLGGLSAATSLAHKGRSVVLLERHNVPGGYSTSFVRRRFEFETALHELSGISTAEKPNFLYRYLDSIGVMKRVDLIRLPTLYRCVFPDLDLTLPYGWERYEQVFTAAFPRESAGLRRLFVLIRKVARSMVGLQDLGLGNIYKPWNLVQIPLKHHEMLRYNQCTWDSVLCRFIKDPQARAVLSQIWGYFGMPPSKIAFQYFAVGLASYIKHGAVYVRGRSQALANAFVAALEEHGGEIKLGCGAHSILTEGNKVVGVVTAEGESIRADNVISNTDPLSTCRDLIGQDKVPAKFFHSFQRASVGPSSINVYLGVARTSEELGFTDHEMFINEDLDYDRQYADCDNLSPPSGIVLTCYNHAYPEISPPGTSMVVLTGLKNGRAFHHIDPAQYLDIKHQMAEGMLDLAERAVPDLRRHAEVVEVATPLTNMRYASTLGGSIYGFNQEPGSHTFWRTPLKGPLRGLYFAGAWTMPGGGFEPVMLSGEMAAGLVHSRMLKKANQGKVA